MSKSTDIDRYQQYLYCDYDKIVADGVAVSTAQRILRLRSCYNYWLKFPSLKDIDVVKHDIKEFSISNRQAYDDVYIVKIILGNQSKTTKDFHRWKFNNMILHAYEEAERLHDAKSMASAARYYAQYNRLHEDDDQDKGYDEIMPQLFEPTSDPTVVGFKPIPNVREVARKMLANFIKQGAEDVEYEEIDLEADKLFNKENQDG